MNQLEKQKLAKVHQQKKPSPPVKNLIVTTTTEPIATNSLKITINNEENAATPPPAPSPVLKITLKDSGRQVKETEELQKVVDVTEKSPRFTDTLRKQILLKNTLAKSADPKAKETPKKAGTALEKAITPLKPPAVKVPEQTAAGVAKKPKVVPKKPAKSIEERFNALNETDRRKFLAKYESNYEVNR
jgi:hypothetical protein